MNEQPNSLLDLSKMQAAFDNMAKTLKASVEPAMQALQKVFPDDPAIAPMKKYKVDRAKARKAKRKNGGHK